MDLLPDFAAADLPSTLDCCFLLKRLMGAVVYCLGDPAKAELSESTSFSCSNRIYLSTFVRFFYAGAVSVRFFGESTSSLSLTPAPSRSAMRLILLRAEARALFYSSVSTFSTSLCEEVIELRPRFGLLKML